MVMATGSLITAVPGGRVTDGWPAKVTGSAVPAMIAPPPAFEAMLAPPIVNGSRPSSLVSLIRNPVPAMLV